MSHRQPTGGRPRRSTPSTGGASACGLAIRSAALASALLLAGCAPLHDSVTAVLGRGVFAAAGPVAAHQRDLFTIAGIVLIFVALPVLLLVPLFAWHYRLANTRHAYRPHWGFSWWVEGLIWIPPLGIVLFLSALLWHWTIVDDPWRPLPGGPPLEVEAVALDWKWLFLYPAGAGGIATVDRLVIPAGRPVRIRLTSGTVMQSFMVPRLAGQVYAMAGMTTQLNLAADHPGTYPGRNTQFNGDGFARQRFAVVAMAPDAFARWAADTRRTAPPLDAAVWARLRQRSRMAAPARFGAIPAHFFDRLVARQGGMAHHQPDGPQ